MENLHIGVLTLELTGNLSNLVDFGLKNLLVEPLHKEGNIRSTMSVKGSEERELLISRNGVIIKNLHEGVFHIFSFVL